MTMNIKVNRLHKKAVKALAYTTAAATMLAMTMAPSAAFAGTTAVEKDESVYVITDATGSENDIIVSDHLINNSQIDKISDKSDLKDIENVKGDEKFHKGKGQEITWDANGNDIYYQGKTDNELPISMKITYKLNGKTISGDKLKGKSGNLEIRIDYENSTSVKGKKVPFVVMSGMIVSDDSFTDVKIDNGKVIDDGAKKVIVGMAAPGLASDLDISESKMGMGDSVTIKGKADKFNVEDIMTIVTNSVFQDVDTDDMDMNFDDEIDQLNKGSKQLVEGSSELYKGLEKLDNKTPELEKGVASLDDGAQQVSNGVNVLTSTVSAQLQELLKNTKKMHDGSLGLVQILTWANGQIKTDKTEVASDVQKLSASLGKIKSASDDITAAGSSLTDAKDAVSKSSISDDADKAKTQIESAKTAVDKLNDIDTEGMTEEQKEAITSAVADAKSALDNADSSVGDVKSSIDDANSKVNGKVADAGADITKVGGDIKDSSDYQKEILSSLYKTDEKGQVTGGVAYSLGAMESMFSPAKKDDGSYRTDTALGLAGAVAEGLGATSEELAKNTDPKSANVQQMTALGNGAAQLAEGMDELYDNTGKIITGVDKLDKGSLELSKGMSKLYNEGIKKIVDMYNDDLKGLTSGLSDTLNAAADYNSYTEMPENMEGSVKFIYKTSILE